MQLDEYDLQVCAVCGPPVQNWWPVHFGLCSNQNMLYVEALGGPAVALLPVRDTRVDET